MVFQIITLRPRVLHAGCSKDVAPVFGHCAQYLSESLGVLSNVGFLLGSILYWPSLGSDSGLAGVWLYFVFSLVNLKLSCWDLYEQVVARRRGYSSKDRLEITETVCYVVSALLFSVGMFFAFPVWQEDGFEEMDAWFSVVGSVALIIAAYLNSLGLAEDRQHTWGLPAKAHLLAYRLKAAALFCTLMGGVLFTIGCFLFLPQVAILIYAEDMGTVLFVAGSVAFLVQSLLGVAGTHLASKAAKQTVTQKPASEGQSA